MENGILFVNKDDLIRTANRWFGGDRRKAKQGIRQRHKGRTVRFTEIWR